MADKEKIISQLIDAVLQGSPIYYSTYISLSYDDDDFKSWTKTIRAELSTMHHRLCTHPVPMDTDFHRTITFQEARKIVERCFPEKTKRST